MNLTLKLTLLFCRLYLLGGSGWFDPCLKCLIFFTRFRPLPYRPSRVETPALRATFHQDACWLRLTFTFHFFFIYVIYNNFRLFCHFTLDCIRCACQLIIKRICMCMCVCKCPTVEQRGPGPNMKSHISNLLYPPPPEEIWQIQPCRGGPIIHQCVSCV